MRRIFILLIVQLLPITVLAEEGSDLWLRYKTLPGKLVSEYSGQIQSLVFETNSSASQTIVTELDKAFVGMLGKTLPRNRKIQNSTLIIGTLKDQSVRKYLSSLRPLAFN